MPGWQYLINQLFGARIPVWLVINVVEAANKRWLPAVGERRVNQDLGEK